jgi:hypothetical protein
MSYILIKMVIGIKSKEITPMDGPFKSLRLWLRLKLKDKVIIMSV